MQVLARVLSPPSISSLISELNLLKSLRLGEDVYVFIYPIGPQLQCCTPWVGNYVYYCLAVVTPQGSWPWLREEIKITEGVS